MKRQSIEPSSYLFQPSIKLMTDEWKVMHAMANKMRSTEFPGLRKSIKLSSEAVDNKASQKELKASIKVKF